MEIQYNLELSYAQMSGVIISKDYSKTTERIKEIINSNMPNSAVVYLYDGKINKVHKELISTYDSAFDFVSALKLGSKERDTICTTVSKINTNFATSGRAEVGVINEKGYKGSAIIKSA